MAKWGRGSETGILRKPEPLDKFEDLLVFGYACKLFRDDEKALFIDKGKHLIPWMGDSSLKIDRYDCRGALSELAALESSDHDASRWLGMSESDRRLELICDEERYYALKHNEEELEMYQEEETKRLQQKGTEFQYNYDVPGNPDQSEEVQGAAEQDEPFVAPPELEVPSDMEVPKTVKENARIEKTATFISDQGPQMEILIKTKQADNSQFFFMNKDDPLYRYYKHLLTAIKSGAYKVKAEPAVEDVKPEDAANDLEEHDGHYLHPSLVATPAEPAQPPPPLPTVVYKPSADCSYTQLVSRIQGTQSDSATPPPPLPAQEAPQGQMTFEQQQYYQQYYYAAQYYEYYKQMAQQFAGQNTEQTSNGALQEDFSPEQFYAMCQNHTDFQSLFQSNTAYQQYMQQTSNPYAQLVSNLSQTKETLTDPASENSLNNISKPPILYSNSEAEMSPIIGPQLPPVVKQNEEEQRPLLCLAQYGSDSDEEENEDELKIPPNELQVIIDKMAVYVSKNGKDFENIVKAKGDPRFQFLQVGHEFNKYYRMKIGENTENVQENGIAGSKVKEKKIIAPVSFSIRKPKEETPKEIKSALPIEESDEEHENSVKTQSVVPPSQTPPPPEVSLTPPLKDPIENGKDEAPPEIPQNATSNKQTEAEDIIVEMMDEGEERRDVKRVENIKKDKITAALRERFALQLERKKKAAAFLKMKSKIDPNAEIQIVNSSSDVGKHKTPACKTSPEIRQVDEIISIDDSDLEEDEIKKRKKSKKKKSHKRKRSKSRHERKKSHHRHKSKEHKKSKKKRRRSETTCTSDSSESS